MLGMKRWLSFVLVMVMLLCAGVGVAESTVALPISEEPITLKMAVAYSSYCLVPWSEKEFYHEVSEATNVYFEWQELQDWSTQTNLMINSGDMPDVFFGAVDSNLLNENREMFWELTEMIEQYCPTLTQAFAEQPYLVAKLKSSDGGIYKLPIGFADIVDAKVGTMYWINQAWLDAVGMESPTTIDELQEVLIAFRDMDPNGNGLQDEIPLSLAEQDWAGKFSSLFGIFGVLYDSATFVDCDDEGNVYFQPSQDEFYEALVWLNGLAKEGLLDQESFTQDGTLISTKIAQDMIGIVAKYNPLNMLDNFVPLGIIEGPNEKTLYEGTNTIVPGNISIPKTCEHPEAVLQVWEYINSDMTRKLSNRYGEEGVYWSYTGNGTDFTLQDYDSTPPEGYEFWDQYIYTVGETGSSGFQLFTRADMSHNKSEYTAREAAIVQYEPYFPAVDYQEATLETDLATEKSMLLTEIEAYVTNFVANAVFSGIDEAAWETHLATLEQLQVDRYVELCQAAYDGFYAMSSIE